MSLEQLQFIKWKAIYFTQEFSLLPVSFNMSYCALYSFTFYAMSINTSIFSVWRGKKTYHLECHFHCQMLLCVCSTDISVKLFDGFIFQPVPSGLCPSSFFPTRLSSMIWWHIGTGWSHKTATTSQKSPRQSLNWIIKSHKVKFHLHRNHKCPCIWQRWAWEVIDQTFNIVFYQMRNTAGIFKSPYFCNLNFLIFCTKYV